MNKKKQASLIIVALLSLSVLAACTSSQPKSSAATRARHGAAANSDTTETQIVDGEANTNPNQTAGRAGRGSGANSGAAGGPGNGQGASAAVVASQPTGTLSADEIAGLLYMREEEKLAHDVYLTLYEKWGTAVFQNIANSEATHTEAIRTLLERYSLEDPAAGNDRGVFTNPELQALYDQLAAQGSESLASALRVGAAIEEIDILDLEERLAQTTRKDIAQVYQNLTAGSRNHLRAFVSVLAQQTGETYHPEYLSQAAFDKIVSKQTGRGHRGGR